MIAMALGNVWGGRSADRDPNPDRLYRRILFAAVWIACIPLLGKYVIAGITVALALSLVYFLSGKVKAGPCVAAVAAFLACCEFGSSTS